MGSLQEQLLKAGLVSEEQLEQSRKKPKPGSRSGQKHSGRRDQRKFQGKKRTGQARQHEAGRSAPKRHPGTANPEGKKEAGTGKSSADLSLEQAYRARQQLERKEVEQTKQRQQREQEARRQRNLKLDEIVKDKALNSKEADVRRYFEYGGRIRHLYVTQKQLEALAANELGIVVLRGRYLIVEPSVRDEFKAVAGDLVPDLSKDTKASDEAAVEATGDDVPDDLRW